MPKDIFAGSSTPYGHNAMDGGGVGFADQTKIIAAQARMVYPEHEGLERLRVYNKADPSETIDVTVARMGRELDSFGERVGRTLITAMLGNIDHVERTGSDGPMTSEVSFQAGLGRLWDICTRYDVRLALLGSPPLDGVQILRSNPRGRLVEHVFDDERRLKYEDIARDFADRNGIPFREVRESLGGNNTRAAGFVSFDNVHGNAAAHNILTYHALAVASEQLDLPDLKQLVPDVMETASGLVIIKPELTVVEASRSEQSGY